MASGQALVTSIGRFLNDPKNRPVHAVIIISALFLHLALHYATYVPSLRPPLDGLPYFRLHVLHEAEFMLIVFYTVVVFRWRGGLVAILVTAVSSIPFLMTPYIFDRPPRPGEVRDLATQVGFILVMALLIVWLYEAAGRQREERARLADELEQANERVESANRQLTALNRQIQANLNLLYDQLRTTIGIESQALTLAPDSELRERYREFLRSTERLVFGPPAPPGEV